MKLDEIINRVEKVEASLEPIKLGWVYYIQTGIQRHIVSISNQFFLDQWFPEEAIINLLHSKTGIPKESFNGIKIQIPKLY